MSNVELEVFRKNLTINDGIDTVVDMWEEDSSAFCIIESSYNNETNYRLYVHLPEQYRVNHTRHAVYKKILTECIPGMYYVHVDDNKGVIYGIVIDRIVQQLSLSQLKTKLYDLQEKLQIIRSNMIAILSDNTITHEAIYAMPFYTNTQTWFAELYQKRLQEIQKQETYDYYMDVL